MTCYVYVIEAGGAVKVGLSSDPQKRVAGLSTGSPFRPTLLHTWLCPDRDEAMRLEREIHSAFQAHRMSGEWFSVAPADVIGVGDCMSRRDHPGAADRLRAYTRHAKIVAAWLRRYSARRSNDRHVSRSWLLVQRSTERLRAAGMAFNPWDQEVA